MGATFRRTRFDVDDVIAIDANNVCGLFNGDTPVILLTTLLVQMHASRLTLLDRFRIKLPDCTMGELFIREHGFCS